LSPSASSHVTARGALDGYVVGPESSYYMDGEGVSRVARLQANLLSAVRAADEYVWIWGERGRWWPDPGETAAWKNKPVCAPWDEVLPGNDFAIRAITQPFAAAIRKSGALERASAPNLARNGDFAATTAPAVSTGEIALLDGGAPAGWGSRQEDDSHGVFGWDRAVGASASGSARISGASGGCFIQHYPVKPGERFVISLRCRAHQVG
jgi:hypothetical protein